jgi:hypothetical protein
VKGVLIGSVPDRGGRPEGRRRHADMPAWTARQAGRSHTLAMQHCMPGCLLSRRTARLEQATTLLLNKDCNRNPWRSQARCSRSLQVTQGGSGGRGGGRHGGGRGRGGGSGRVQGGRQGGSKGRGSKEGGGKGGKSSKGSGWGGDGKGKMQT